MARLIAVFGLLWGCSLAGSVPARADEGRAKDGKDDVVGAIWSYTLHRENKEEKGQFRVHDHEVFRGANKVGRVKPKSAKEATLIINDYPELNGRAEIRKTDAQPPIWQGVLKRDNGAEWKIEIEIKDR